MPIESVRPQRLYLQITHQLLRAIGNGELVAGEALPHERLLAEQLGVSRAPVREALAVLEVMGVIEIRPGQGTFVRQHKPNVIPSARHINHTVNDVIDARLVFEEGIVRHLCRQDTVDMSSSLEAHFAQTASAHDRNDAEAFLALSLQFHNVLATLCAHHIVSHVIEQLTSAQDQPLFRVLNRLALSDAHNREEQDAEHRALIKAIVHHDETQAVTILRQHLHALRTMMITIDS